MFDYSYDSGDDWEEEEEGGEDIVSDGGSDGEGIDDEEDDDGFLVPDDEVESVGHPSIPSRSPSPTAFRSDAKGKRKAEGIVSGANKRRQIVGPLIPFSKGPCYENEIGQCEYEPFNAFRIHLLNGTFRSLSSIRETLLIGYIRSRHPVRHRPILVYFHMRGRIPSIHDCPEATSNSKSAILSQSCYLGCLGQRFHERFRYPRSSSSSPLIRRRLISSGLYRTTTSQEGQSWSIVQPSIIRIS